MPATDATNLPQTPNPAPLVIRAFWVLVVQSFQRHWRVRQMGWVAVGLLGITVVWVAAVTASPAAWGLENSRVRRFPITYRQYAEELLPSNRYAALVGSADKSLAHPAHDPTGSTRLRPPPPSILSGTAFQNLILSVPHAILSSTAYL
jgi:ABC-2 type transport system permease protein